jgi:hypothetical protein
MPFTRDSPYTAAVWFAVALLAVVVLWYYATAFVAPATDHSGTLMDLFIDPATLSGIQHREQTHCRRRAQRRLWELGVQQRLRAMMLRDGGVWLVVAGEALTVAPGKQPSHYLRHHGPVTDGADGATIGAPPGMIVRAHTTVDPSAISTKAEAITRHATVAAARAALPPDTDTERHYIFVTGLAADPSAYVVRVVRSAPNDGLVATGGGASSAVMLRTDAAAP